MLTLAACRLGWGRAGARQASSWPSTLQPRVPLAKASESFYDSNSDKGKKMQKEEGRKQNKTNQEAEGKKAKEKRKN